MDFYSELEIALFSADINTKELIVNRAISYCLRTDEQVCSFEPKVQEEPSYAQICKIVPPKELPKRKDFNSKDGLIALVHSITHIEFSAIDLAIDAVYRFPNMPTDYKLDWLIVAQDEIRHFRMLLEILNKLGAEYGDLPVHKGLFEMAYKTKQSIIERMAVIPRYFEAGGLDVNPKITAKLQNFKSNPIVAELLDALEIIYNEEIEHVSKGDLWFKYLCDIENSDYQDRYLEIINKYKLIGRASNFDIEGRKKAGFSCSELIALGAKECS